MRSRADDIASLKSLFRDIPSRPDVWVRASEHSNHLGAVIADTVLQAGVNYLAVVKPRVERVLREYPEASTLSGLQRVLAKTPPDEFLQNRYTRKCAVLVSLTQLLAVEHIETSEDLRRWLEHPDSKRQLLRVPGIKHKTAAYLRLLMGLPAVAIDVHLRRMAASVGVVGSDEELESLFTEAAASAGIPLRDLDGSMWQAVLGPI